MIHSVSIQPNLCTGESDYGYELGLASLFGETFTFEKGLNVIVGKNGVGKTSLLNVIRYLTFCDKQPYSAYDRRQCDTLRVESHYRNRYWDWVELKMDFTKSVFNLNKTAEVNDQEVNDSALNLANRWEKNCHSEGETLFGDVNQLVGILMNNGERKGMMARDFRETVTKVMEKRRAQFGECKTGDMLASILAYNERNHVADNGYTVLFDEPDKGLDVFYAQDIYEFLRDCYKFKECDLQYIAVLHNVAIIKALLESGAPVRFIELTPGYLDAVRDFGKGKAE